MGGLKSLMGRIKDMYPSEAVNNLTDYVADYKKIGEAKAAAEAKDQETRRLVQDMFDARRKELEKDRTDDIRLSAFNSLGNALRAMVQPIGWAAGGGRTAGGVATAGVQPYDNRQYLEAFNRAVKANDDIRNLGTQEMEYNINFANKDAERAWSEYETLANQRFKEDAEERAFNRKLQILDTQQAGRIELEHIKGMYKLQKAGGGKVGDDVQTAFLKRAATAYNNYKADYMKKRAFGINPAEPLQTWEQFLGAQAAREGYSVVDNVGASNGNSGNGGGGNNSSNREHGDF